MESLAISTTVIFLILLCLIGLNYSDAQTTYLYHFCTVNSSDSSNSTSLSNLNLLLSSLRSNSENSSGFMKTPVGQEPNILYGLYLCRGDVTNERCHDCVETAIKEILQRCPSTLEAIIWFDECMLRYSNQIFFGDVTLFPSVQMWNVLNISEPDEPDLDARYLMYGLTRKTLDSALMFGTDELIVNKTEKRYSLAQCSRDLSSQGCKNCLVNLTESRCCEGKRGWRLLTPSCNLRYESYPFYETESEVPTPMPQPKEDQPEQPAPMPQSKKGKESSLLKILVTTISAAFGVVVLLGSYIYYTRSRNRRRKGNTANQQGALETNIEFFDDYIQNEESGNAEFPTIPLSIIRQATSNFSEQFKLGEGGFGPVYKGILPDGKQVAVKRLSKTSGQGLEEFKNEVILIAKLQHRNLVRLLGCCIEENEKLLVYEYMPNGSLDLHLFGTVKSVQLHWKLRLSIINGIARGLQYLHEDSRLRVIHRDLKASNILLDHEMNPRISDFGLARAFGEEQTTVNTRRVMGTYGYMAPEYAMEGLFSIKSDVFSFGVLLLEIICGKINSGFYLSEHGQSLLSYAWRLWDEGKALELMDPLIENSNLESEVLKCVHIGLLCVQEDPADRPIMSTVIFMLASDTVTLPKPTQPAFSVGRVVGNKEPLSEGSNNCSVNQITVCDVTPR